MSASFFSLDLIVCFRASLLLILFFYIKYIDVTVILSSQGRSFLSRHFLLHPIHDNQAPEFFFQFSLTLALSELDKMKIPIKFSSLSSCVDFMTVNIFSSEPWSMLLSFFVILKSPGCEKKNKNKRSPFGYSKWNPRIQTGLCKTLETPGNSNLKVSALVIKWPLPLSRLIRNSALSFLPV